MSEQLVVRSTIAVIALVALLAHAYWTGNQAPGARWYVHFGRAGIALLVVVAGSVQLKLYRYDVPIDGWTWATMLAVAVIAVGFGAMSVADVRKHRRPRRSSGRRR